jgi:hypothetical protein
MKTALEIVHHLKRLCDFTGRIRGLNMFAGHKYAIFLLLLVDPTSNVSLHCQASI